MAHSAWVISAFVLFFAGSVPAIAAESSGNLDPVSSEALESTKALLTDPTKRAEALRDPKAAAADQNLKSLGLSPESEAAAYAISAEILEKWVKETSGDAEAMKKKALDYQRNPSSFLNELTPAQAEKIHRMSKEVSGPRSAP